MILEKLRKNTSDAHRNLESLPLLKPLSSGPITVDVYINILKRFYGYFNPVEVLIRKFDDLYACLPDLDERRTSHLILHDLKCLNANYDHLPKCMDLPKITSTANAFGALYVLEGSTLGGSIISRRINDTLALKAGDGCSFFSGYLASTGLKWKIFKDAIHQFVEDNPEEEGQVIKSANETFDKFSTWLKQ